MFDFYFHSVLHQVDMIGMFMNCGMKNRRYYKTKSQNQQLLTHDIVVLHKKIIMICNYPTLIYRNHTRHIYVKHYSCFDRRHKCIHDIRFIFIPCSLIQSTNLTCVSEGLNVKGQVHILVLVFNFNKRQSNEPTTQVFPITVKHTYITLKQISVQ
jgi:hypothetical protein